MNLNNIAIVAVGRALGHGWAYEIERADGDDIYEIMKSIGAAAKAYNARPENENWPTAAVSNFELFHDAVWGRPTIMMETASRFDAYFNNDDSGVFSAWFTDGRFLFCVGWGRDIDGHPSFFVEAPSDPGVRREMAEKKAACGAITPILYAARYLADNGVVYSDYHAGCGPSILAYNDYVEFCETVRAVLDAPLPEAATASLRTSPNGSHYD